MAKKDRNQAKRMASQGKSADYIERKTGVSTKAAQRFTTQAAAARTSAATPSTPTPTTPEVKGLGQGLRIAGGGYGIGKSEFDKIVGTETDPGKIIRRLDKVNANLSEKDKTGISLKSGAVNKLIRKASKLNPLERSQLNFGTGRMGMQIQGMLGDPGFAGAMIQGRRVGAREAVEPTFLDKGMDLGPKGRKQVRGIGKQYEVPARLMGAETTAGETVAGDTEAEGTTAEEVTPVEPIVPEESTDNSLSSGAGGLDLASWATGFRRAKSSRKRAGRGAQGLASMKKAPFTSWYK